MHKMKFEYRISLAYFLIALAWIYFSDMFLEIDPKASAERISHLQTIKGGFYVIATSLMLLLFIRKHLGRLRSAEAELERHRLHLTEMVKEKTRELDDAIEKLRESNQLLTRQNEVNDLQNIELKAALNEVRSTQAQLAQSDRMTAIGVLTSGLSSEIGNPLHNIENGLHQIATFLKNSKIENSEIEHLAFTLQTNIHKISKAVSGINQLSSSNFSCNEKCDIHAILDNCLAILNYHLTGKIKVEKDYLDELLLVKGNTGQLHQAFISILINAVQAIQHTGIIRISTDLKDNKLLVQIADTGCGIEQQHLPHVTDPFFTTRDNGQSSGLGLSISYTIIKNHEGDITISSEPGQGTQVTISLPIIPIV